jgi:hypothetical protein
MALGLSQLSCGAQSAGVVSGKNVARSNGVMISSARDGQIAEPPACERHVFVFPLSSLRTA